MHLWRIMGFIVMVSGQLAMAAKDSGNDDMKAGLTSRSIKHHTHQPFCTLLPAPAIPPTQHWYLLLET